MTTAAATTVKAFSTAAPPLNVYKKVAVIRCSSDTLTFEDAEGIPKIVSIQELGDAIATAVSICMEHGRKEGYVNLIYQATDVYELLRRDEYKVRNFLSCQDG